MYTPATSQIGTTATHPTAKPPSKGLLLLVDDLDVNRLLLKAMAGRLSYQTKMAVDGADALDKIDKAIADNRPFDLILMDAQMPVMDGYQATRMIRTSGISAADLPIIATSANAADDDIDRSLAAGMQGYLAKPIMIGKLQLILEQWIRPKTSEHIAMSIAEPSALLSPQLREKYEARKKTALHCLSNFMRLEHFQDWQLHEALDHLHKLSGTAAMFGEAELGTKAGRIEIGLKEWKFSEREQKMRHALDELLAAA